MEWFLCSLVGAAGGLAWVLQGQIFSKRELNAAKGVKNGNGGNNPNAGQNPMRPEPVQVCRHPLRGIAIEIAGATLVAGFLAPALFKYPDELGRLLGAAFVLGCAWPRLVRGFRKNMTATVRDMLKDLRKGGE